MARAGLIRHVGKAIALACIVTLFAGSLPASAQPGPDQAPRRMDRMPDDRRDWQQRDRAGKGPGRMREPGNGMGPRHGPGYGQMSPEEREQLRRDIREHGRDVYRDRGPGRR